MRIAMFTELMAPSVGGVEARFAELAAALTRSGHEVDVYCVGHVKGMAAEVVERGVAVHRHPIITDYRRSMVPGMPRNLTTIMRYGWHTRQVLRRRDFDLHIFGQWPFSHVLLAPRSARRTGLIDWCEVRGGPVYGSFERWLPRMTAMNMGVSASVAAQIKTVSGRSVLPLLSGVNVADYWSAPTGQRSGIAYIGRLFPHKRVPMLVTAFGELRARGYQGGLTIAGDGPSRGEIEAARLRLAVADRESVDILGHIDDQAKFSLLAHAEVLVLPSQREGFPLAVAEAMAAGLPVVTTSDAGNGARDVVRLHGLGVVADPSVDALATAIEDVLKRWAHYSSNALAAAPQLDWNHLVSVLETMIAERASAA
jgi:glycosyltransferase involved in cell wall biosynthesis